MSEKGIKEEIMDIIIEGHEKGETAYAITLSLLAKFEIKRKDAGD